MTRVTAGSPGCRWHDLLAAAKHQRHPTPAAGAALGARQGPPGQGLVPAHGRGWGQRHPARAGAAEGPAARAGVPRALRGAPAAMDGRVICGFVHTFFRGTRISVVIIYRRCAGLCANDAAAHGSRRASGSTAPSATTFCPTSTSPFQAIRPSLSSRV